MGRGFASPPPTVSPRPNPTFQPLGLPCQLGVPVKYLIRHGVRVVVAQLPRRPCGVFRLRMEGISGAQPDSDICPRWPVLGTLIRSSLRPLRRHRVPSDASCPAATVAAASS